MGKLKKRQRVEKAKVKLKKKQLLKAQNVTETSFKVRKIIIPTQLKEVSGDEPLSKRKLNIKELISRLKHHNDTARQGAVAGLGEVMSQHTDDELSPHFLTVAQALVEMIVVEVSTKIRRDAIKLLQAILSQVPADKIAPFFRVLLWHLTCAMTHINAQIQEDSLFLFDTLLACAPSLVASAASDLLPSFLNMISRLRAESRPGRTLTLDLGSSQTTMRWRGEVLTRVQAFLHVVVGGGERQKATEAAAGPRMYHWTGDKPLYVPAYLGRLLLPCELPDVFHRTVVESAQGESVNPRVYAQELMPLLFETWLEVRPSASFDQKAQLNQEATQLMITVVDIIQFMYDFMSLEKHKDAKHEEMRKWFALTFRDDFNRYIVADFPYTQAERVMTKGQDDQPGNKDAHANIRLANLTICYLFLVLNTVYSVPHAAKVSRCIKRSMGQWHVLDERCRKQLLRVLRCVLLDRRCEGVDSLTVLRVLTAACLRQPEDDMLFLLLCELINRHRPHSMEILSPWLAALPQLLCRSEVSSSFVDSLSRLACQHIPAFWEAFVTNLPQFIRNLGTVKVRGDEVDGRLRLAGLLYWVPRWNDKQLVLLQSEMKKWDPALTCYVKQLIVH